MLILNKLNLIPYLQQHMPGEDFSGSVSILSIGEDSLSMEEAGDGYVNYIFLVRTRTLSLAVKQSRETSRRTGGIMTLTRNRLEYDALKLFYAISPDYVPKVYFIDDDNRVFVMEDVSQKGRKISRFQLNLGRVFPQLGRQCGIYLADTEFYTSEFYLGTSDFRQLTSRFMNEQMRPIMENGVFLDRFGTEYDSSLGEEFTSFARSISEDPQYMAERHKLRRLYMTRAECLIHADLHTSNLFASIDSMKVIDLEFTFCGPFAYDIGYLTGSLLSQYAAACYRDFPSEEKRFAFKNYLLRVIVDLYLTYTERFAANWKKDAKPIYQDVPGLLEDFTRNILIDAPGYASIVNWFRVAGAIEYPDFDIITNPDKKRDAMTLSLLIDWQIMFHRYEYTGIDDLIDDILYAEQRYQSSMWKSPAVKNR